MKRKEKMIQKKQLGSRIQKMTWPMLAREELASPPAAVVAEVRWLMKWRWNQKLANVDTTYIKRLEEWVSLLLFLWKKIDCDFILNYVFIR